MMQWRYSTINRRSLQLLFRLAGIGMMWLLLGTSCAYARDTVQLSGDIVQLALPAIASVFVIGHRDDDGALQLLESSVLTLGITYGLKYTIPEKRPNGGAHSFPSAHTSISFAMAEFLRERYGWAPGIVGYVGASFVAYSRVESKAHFTHDVLAGAVIGVVSSHIFTRHYRHWQVLPEMRRESHGINVCVTW